ncbi:type II toxin-antitoxin system Phd/YefM family antitoxin [Candidatus Palauibacter sp.]|uniref:type II toxin-antitoxin system Phd/YefM family antitoxin n=1 Tax=Candidatus Palauibacter sp. TaxID=3101350 RepID=UPI003B02B9E1
MIEVGTFEAKTHLSSLLKRVADGEEVLITRRGVPVARIVSAGHATGAEVDRAIEELIALREGLRLDGLSWKDLRDAGRR